jgi:hypothetical protein
VVLLPSLCLLCWQQRAQVTRCALVVLQLAPWQSMLLMRPVYHRLSSVVATSQLKAAAVSFPV